MNTLRTLCTVLMTLGLAVASAATLRAADPATTAAATTAPTTQQSEELLGGLRKKLEAVTSVQADFVQEKKLSIFARTLVIRGRFAVERPKRLVWHVSEPVKYSISVEGDVVRFWDEDTNHVQEIHIGPKHDFRAVFEQFQGWFQGDYHTLSDSYDVKVLTADPITIRFQPSATSPMVKIIQFVEATFQADKAYLQSIAIHEGGGDTTTIRFTNTKLNAAIPPEIWEIPPHAR